MKKSLVLTSLLALAACGGGSGGSGGGSAGGDPAAPVNPVNPLTPATGMTMQSFTAGQGSVNADNAELTNMASYTTTYSGSSSVESEIKSYVNNLLGSSRAGLLKSGARAASNRVVRDTDPEFAAADTRITNMKQVLYDMAHLSGAELTAYVTDNTDAVKEAFVLWTNNTNTVSDETTVADLITAFGGFGLTEDNVMTQFDAFDTNKFHFSKEYMDNVKLRDTGQDAYFKFDMDEGGAITTVSLWENPTSEYGTSWTVGDHQKKIVLNEGGTAASIVTGQGLNPFGNDDDEYMNSNAGYLARNGTAFSNTIYHYEFDLGNHNLGAGLVISESSLASVDIESDTQLDVETAKQKLKNYIIEKVNKKLHNQNGGTENPAVLQQFLDVANYYIGHIDDIVNASFVEGAAAEGTIAQTVTMHGIGKDVGLKYADFGYSKMVRTSSEGTNSQYLTYVGGYDARRMNNTPANNSLENGATFTGTAIVTVEDHHKNKTENIDERKTALYKDTSATLTYNIVGDNARHTLAMNNLKATDGQASENSDWYAMVVQGTENNPTMNVTFNAAGKTIDSDYQFFKADSEGNITRNEADNIAAADRIVNTTGAANEIDMFNGTTSSVETHHRLNGTASAEYYGADPANPTEATAGVWMDERWANGDDKIQHEVAVYGAFGGKK